MPDSVPGAVRVEEVELPGIGMRYDLMTQKGRRVGIVQHRSGRRDLLVFSREDPDACSETVRMTDEESMALAELLGVPRIVDTLTGMAVEGLMSEQIPIEADSPFADRTLGETQARTRTGASIVAVIRGEETVISPAPDFRFQRGDAVVVVGTREGVRRGLDDPDRLSRRAMDALFLELGAIIFGLGVLGRLAGLIGMSPIPLYLLAGLAFGRDGLLPLATSHEFLEVGSEIGVVLLLLLLGLEYTADELVRNLRAQAPAGGANIVLNAAPGVAIALILRWPLPAVLAMGRVTYCASSGIAAKLLQDFGRIGNRETPIVLSLLVLEDLSMAFYLPVLTAVVAGVGVVRGVEAEVVAILALGVVLIVALRFSHLVNRLVFSEDNEVLLLRVLGLALIVAGVAGLLEVSEAVGAFLIGIALSGRVAEGAREVLAPLRDLFAAVFFVLFGLNTDAFQIPGVLGLAVLLGAVTMVTKVATGWWAAWRAGIGPIGRVRAGTVIAARGEFNIVIATLAASTTPQLTPLAATYVLLMAVVGPLVARAGEPVAVQVRSRYLGWKDAREAAAGG